MSYELRNDRRYSKTHEWVKVEGNVATIGITSFAVDSLGGITQIELSLEKEGAARVPLEKGMEVKKGDSIAVIDTAKTAEDVYTPVSGKIVDLNKVIEDDPEVVENSPYDDGWFVKIEVENPEEVKDLMDDESYRKMIEESK
ncbi:MAG: glycine cleavage system protein GcvH [Candidatus Asgardarchaeia archaeon]